MAPTSRSRQRSKAVLTAGTGVLLAALVLTGCRDDGLLSQLPPETTETASTIPAESIEPALTGAELEEFWAKAIQETLEHVGDAEGDTDNTATMVTGEKAIAELAWLRPAQVLVNTTALHCESQLSTDAAGFPSASTATALAATPPEAIVLGSHHTDASALVRIGQREPGAIALGVVVFADAESANQHVDALARYLESCFTWEFTDEDGSLQARRSEIENLQHHTDDALEIRVESTSAEESAPTGSVAADATADTPANPGTEPVPDQDSQSTISEETESEQAHAFRDAEELSVLVVRSGATVVLHFSAPAQQVSTGLSRIDQLLQYE